LLSFSGGFADGVGEARLERIVHQGIKTFVAIGFTARNGLIWETGLAVCEFFHKHCWQVLTTLARTSLPSQTMKRLAAMTE